MTSRREFVGGLGILLTGTLSGCAGKLEEITGGPRTIGDSATYKGVKVTPDKYILTSSVTTVVGRYSNTRNASPGATYLLTHLTIDHEGDSAQELPETYSDDAIDAYYDGERVSDGGMIADGVETYIVEGKQLTSYRQAQVEANATGEVYPGTIVDGWLFNEVAKNFDPSKLELRIVWNKQILGDEGETVQKWRYTKDAEASIEDAEGDGSDIISI